MLLFFRRSTCRTVPPVDSSVVDDLAQMQGPPSFSLSFATRKVNKDRFGSSRAHTHIINNKVDPVSRARRAALMCCCFYYGWRLQTHALLVVNCKVVGVQGGQTASVTGEYGRDIRVECNLIIFRAENMRVTNI